MEDKIIQKPIIEEHKVGHTTFEEYKEYVDTSTGEIITSCRGTTRTQDKEPDYVKLYLNTMMSFQGIDNISTDLLISLCNHLSNNYSNSEKEPLVFRNDSYNKIMMANELGVGLPMIKKHIKKLVDAGILIKTNMRSIYYVNPWLLARGKWSNIKKLQMHFDIVNGKWQVDSVLSPNEEEEEYSDA